MSKLFDVVIKDMKGDIVSTVGKQLSEKQAEKREMTALSRINSNYFVDVIPSKKEVGGKSK